MELYDKRFCKGNLLKGYSGCCCQYCQDYKSLRGKWSIQIHGSRIGGFEISVLRENNRHGKASYGWFDEDKILIVERDTMVPKRLWDAFLKLAKKESDRLNKK